MITIIGPTACGKTRLAANLAYNINSEIISADSRQVYVGMDIGTGKDIKDYTVNGRKIKYHLIDIVPAGEKYNLYQYNKDFYKSYNMIKEKGILHPILCGGSGLYIESIIRNYNLPDVPADETLRNNLENMNIHELTNILKSYKKLHNKTDLDSKQRIIRAIEIEEFIIKNGGREILFSHEKINAIVILLNIDREERRRRISQRLIARINEGLIDEVKILIDSGVDPDTLIYYGLEYKFVTLYLLGKISKDMMLEQLEIAIHQFAKRQMTWFRGMEKRGIEINKIDASMSLDNQLNEVMSLIENYEQKYIV